MVDVVRTPDNSSAHYFAYHGKDVYVYFYLSVEIAAIFRTHATFIGTFLHFLMLGFLNSSENNHFA